VAVVCGASGVGKSRVAIGLAARHGVPLAEADDIVTALQAVTRPEQHSLLHLWSTRPAARWWPPERVAEQHFMMAEALRPAFAAVIADHLAFDAPIVFEGDYLLPELSASHGTAVRAVVVQDHDADRLVDNFAAREPGDGDQGHRARTSVIVGAELARRAAAARVPVVSARPWATGLDRVDRAISDTQLDGRPAGWRSS
jgi:2-phosphoglycerate kinase